jgi:protein dithiol oxidoreductase (disulfide-forming)
MKKVARLLLALAAFWLLSTGPALADDAAAPAADNTPVHIVEGVDYKLVTPPQPTEVPDKIEVREIFWYGCPHCFAFEPYLNAWLKTKPADVNFVRTPGIFRESWVPHAKAYYTAKALGVLDKFHPAFFHAIHVEHRRFLNEDDYAAMFAEVGVSKKDFENTFNSFTVNNEVKEAIKLDQAYGIEGVPAMIVAGKYQTSAGLAGSFERMLKIVDALVDKVREESGKH